MILIEIFLSWFLKKSTPCVKLSCIWDTAQAYEAYDITVETMNDLKNQAYHKLKNRRLLKKVNDAKFLMVRFDIVCYEIAYPRRNLTHLFYYDGDSLYSDSLENKEMYRAMAVNHLIKD